MPVKVAKTAGFCWGVRRAMDIVLDVANLHEDDLYTVGPIIHNTQVTEMLASKHVTIREDLSETPQATAIVRTHGITPQKRQALQDSGATLHDATCPFVLRIHGIIRKYVNMGWDVVIVGDRGHAEVNGLFGTSNEQAYIIEKEDEVDLLPPLERACIVVQTTYNTQSFERLVEKLRHRAPTTEVFNTICEDTDERQTELIRMCAEVDAMVIVGGAHSANTARLAGISERQGRPTVKIETEAEVDAAWVRNYRSIGVMAGASTPTWIIRNVADTLERYQRNVRPWLPRVLDGFVRFATASYAASGLGALCLVLVSSFFLGLPISGAALALAFCLIFSLLVFIHLGEGQEAAFDDPHRSALFRRHRNAFYALASAAGALSVILSAISSWAALGLVLLLFAFGHVGHPQRRGLRSLSKGVAKRVWSLIYRYGFVGGAWLSAGLLIPWLMTPAADSAPSATALWLTGLLVIGIIFLLSILLDLGDMEADRIGGRPSLPILTGGLLAGRILHMGNGVLILATILGAAFGALPWLTLTVLAPLAALSMLRIAQQRCLYFSRNVEESLAAGVLPLFALVTLAALAL